MYVLKYVSVFGQNVIFPSTCFGMVLATLLKINMCICLELINHLGMLLNYGEKGDILLLKCQLCTLCYYGQLEQLSEIEASFICFDFFQSVAALVALARPDCLVYCWSRRVKFEVSMFTLLLLKKASIILIPARESYHFNFIICLGSI